MKENLSHFTLRIPQILLDKLAYIALYEGRSKNKEIEQLVKKRISAFEKEHGAITQEDLTRLYNNDLI